MMELFNFEKICDFTSFTLIIPSVSVGNVGQLTADLIISTYNLQRYAMLWHPGIIPMVGSNPYNININSICTSCELYVNEELKLAVLQLRSSIEVKLAYDVFTKLRDKLVELAFGNVIVLTSTFAYELHTVESSHFRYIGNDENITLSQLQPWEVEENGRYVISGSGYALKLYEILKDLIPTTVLIKYVSEGDNIPDAVATLDLLCGLVDKLNDRNKYQIKFPVSWNFVFGNPPPVGMY